MEKGLCLVLLLGLPVFSDAAKTNPSDDQNLIRGKNIFMKYCSACHGSSAKGEGYRLLGPHPADLTSRGTAQQSPPCDPGVEQEVAAPVGAGAAGQQASPGGLERSLGAWQVAELEQGAASRFLRRVALTDQIVDPGVNVELELLAHVRAGGADPEQPTEATALVHAPAFVARSTLKTASA